MRELTMTEIGVVSGGTETCSATDAVNTYSGVADVAGIGRDIINAYEGLVEAASHIIERVATSLD